MSDMNVLADINEMIINSDIMDKSKEIVEQLKPPDELFDLIVKYAGDSLSTSIELFSLHPGVLVIIIVSTIGIKKLLITNFKSVPNILNYPVSFVLAIILYGFISPFVLPEIIKIIG